MQYTRFMYPALAFAIVLGGATSLAAQRPERDPVAPAQDATVRGNPVTAPLSLDPIVAASTCELTYERADNMWAAEGQPDGQLGKEVIRLPSLRVKLFHSYWRYEKEHNRGTDFYGSHARILTNTGPKPVVVALTTTTGWIELKIGERRLVRADLLQVGCGS